MGANAQTAVPVFTSGQVLTAQQQTEINTGIPVFATTVTRDAAFGGTGEKTLAEGQFAYIEATNTTQYYDGSTWQAVGASGLVFLSSTTFTTATNVSLPASTFTSTYANYKVMLSLTAVSADADFTMRLRAAGSDATTANYDSMFAGMATTGVDDQIGVAQTSFLVGESDGAVFVDEYALTFDIFSPQLTAKTRFLGNYVFVDKAAGKRVARSGGGLFALTTSFDSLTFISSVASSISGTVRVYGYANS